MSINKRKSCVFTMVYNEPFFYPIWRDYYSKFFAQEDIYVIHATKKKKTEFDEWFTKNHPNAFSYENGENITVRELVKIKKMVEWCQRMLFDTYEYVLYTDADEIVYCPFGLDKFIETLTGDTEVCTGYEIIHDVKNEKPINKCQSIMHQRRFGYYNSVYNKPLISKIKLDWDLGFHTSEQTNGKLPNPNLFLIHLHKVDFDIAEQRNLERMHGERDTEKYLELSEGLSYQNMLYGERLYKWWFNSLYYNKSPIEFTETPMVIRNCPI